MSEGKRTVLVLDDNEIVRECLVGLFEDRDWQVLQAETAEEALDLLKGREVDSAVVDIRLPGMDGNDFIRWALTIRPQLVCIICAGSPEYDVEPDVAALPVVGAVYAKPVESLVALEQKMKALVDAGSPGVHHE
jgi:CheY-like chemotaxis protein